MSLIKNLWFVGNLRVLKFLENGEERKMLDAVKITFDNGDTIITDFNSQVSREEIAKYYM